MAWLCIKQTSIDVGALAVETQSFKKKTNFILLPSIVCLSWYLQNHNLMISLFLFLFPSDSYKNEITSNNVFSVFDLPVFGARDTISGRTLRYTYGNRRTCVPLLPSLTGDNVTTLRASFGGRDVAGNVFFVSLLALSFLSLSFY